MDEDMLRAYRCIAWDTYFAGLMSISHHPKNGEPARTPEQCARIADEMLIERDKRMQDGRL